MGRRIHGSFLTACLCVLAVGASSSAGVLYVDAGATGANDGSSWQNAYTYLQDALAAAGTADKPLEIRVARGIYKPDQGTGITPGDCDATFQLLDGVTLAGGYAGIGSADPNARDVALYETILSGDLKGDDADVNDLRQVWAAKGPVVSGNSRHVVTASGTDATAVLDGFTITAGSAEAPSSSLPSDPLGGGGLYNDGGSPTVSQCVFRGNFAIVCGGAVYNRDGSPIFSRCTFDRNASRQSGGAMYNHRATVALTACTFSRNTGLSPGWGGAIANGWCSHAAVRDCTFTDNEGGDGGAIYSNVASVVELSNCRFERNRSMTQAAFGGGAVFSRAGDLTMTDCQFDENSAGHCGGAIYMGGGMLHIWRCVFTGNTIGTARSWSWDGGSLHCEFGTIATLAESRFEGNTATRGGAVYNGGHHMEVTQCSFADNVARGYADSLFEGDGGAFYNAGSWLHLTDCTFERNKASNTGGAFVCSGSGHAFLTRCEFTGNGADQGGAMVAAGIEGPLVNCLFAGNRARQGGAMYGSSAGSLGLRNCTFADNSADEGPSFAGGSRNMTLDFSHCILWDGLEALWGEHSLQVTITYSDVRGGYEGTGNIDAGPCFVAPGHWSRADDPNAVWVAGDYHLRSQGGPLGPSDADLGPRQ